MKIVSELIDLNNKRAIVLGGCGHIGMAAVAALMEFGVNIVIIDKEIDDIPKEIKHNSLYNTDKIHYIKCDLESEVENRKSIKDAIALLGGLDIIIHLAAFVGSSDYRGWAEPFASQTTEFFKRALNVNLVSAFTSVHEAQDALIASGNGKVILFGSIYGVVGPDFSLYENTNMANPVGYGVSKGGINQLTKYLALILAPSVCVNCISPGGIFRNQPESFHLAYNKKTPLKRMATEDDLKGTIIFLSSSMSNYITGQNIIVDGGYTIL